MPTNHNRSLTEVAANLKRESEQPLVFERFLPAEEIEDVCREKEYIFRDRVYNPVVTIWMFLGQTLSADHSCSDTLHRFNAWRVMHSKPTVSSNTTQYCKARKRIPEPVFAELAKRSASQCQKTADSNWNWKGHNVKVVDGTTLTMADTKANQKEYPQQKGQKKGCGFPIVRCVMMFCLATGALLDLATAPYRGKETGQEKGVRPLCCV